MKVVDINNNSRNLAITSIETTVDPVEEAEAKNIINQETDSESETYSDEISQIISENTPKTRKPRAVYTICSNTDLAAQLIPMINKAYEETEKDMWSCKVIRCEFIPKPIKQMIVDREMILAYVENELAGCVYFNINPETKICYFSLLAVKEEFRGFGIGTKLVDHVEFLAKERGAIAVECDTLTLAEHDEKETENFERTKKFVAGWYVKLGYEIVEVLPTMTHEKFMPMRSWFQRPMWSLKYRKEISYLM